MKSGTSYLQRRLEAGRGRLADAGVLYPAGWGRQVRAVTDLGGRRDATDGAWSDLVAEIGAHDGHALVSMEFLGPLSARSLERLVEDLAGTPVHAVATLRDLGRNVPAMWQETLKNRATHRFAEYVESIRTVDAEGRRFWRRQDAGAILTAWVEHLGAEHVSAVTVPPPGADREVLWERFTAATGLTALQADGWAAPDRGNESLGAASAGMMRMLNAETADLDRHRYNRRVKHLAKHVLGPRRGSEDTIGFTVPGWLRERAQQVVEQVVASGADLVGSPSDLTPVDVDVVDPDDVPAGDVAAAAVHALGALARSRDGLRADGQPS